MASITARSTALLVCNARFLLQDHIDQLILVVRYFLTCKRATAVSGTPIALFHCITHILTIILHLYHLGRWKKQIVKLQKDAKKAGKSKKSGSNLY